jgi:hypothetical protein
MKLHALFLVLCTFVFTLVQAQPNITKIEYFYNTDPGFGLGTDVPITASPALSNFNFTADVTSLPSGFHTLFVRAQDANTLWSATHSRPFYILNGSTTGPRANITALEYFIDADPGFGGGTSVPVTPSPDITDFQFAVDLSATTEGFHTLFIRSQDATGAWSMTSSRPFYILGTSAPSSPDITKLEYFIDTDPGFGAGTDVPVTPATSVTDLNFVIPLGGIAEGFHTLFVRSKDANEQWSITHSRPFYILSTSAAAAPDLTKIEYFIDSDPGFGAGVDVPFSAGASVNDLAFAVPLGSAGEGFHTLFVRSQNSAGEWSMTHSRPFYILNGSGSSVPNITKLEYFIDTDPGFGAGSDVPVTPGIAINDLSFAVPLNVSPGFHTLFVRSQDAAGNWSNAYSRPFYILNNAAAAPANLTKIEYFFGDDPGSGNALPVSLPSTSSLTDHIVSIDLNQLRVSGQYELNVRAQDENGNWSNVVSRSLDVCIQPIPAALDATDIIPGSFTANWQDTAAAPGYKLYVSKDNFNTYITGYEGKSTAALMETISGLSGGTYDYRVRAVGASCESGLSNIISALLPYIAVAEADSLALVSLYNSTSGAQWNNNINWTTGYVETWFGVTVTDFKITAIQLPGNRLIGTVPPEVATLKDVQTIDLSNNQISGIPDLSVIPVLTTLNVAGNALDFGDLEPNASINTLTYDNQAEIGIAKTELVDVGLSHDVTITTGGTQNTYQWKRNNTLVENAIQNSFTINPVNRATMGVYVCEVSNPLLPAVTLVTRPQTILATANLSGKLYAETNVPASSGELTLLKVTASNGYDTIGVKSVGSDGSYLFDKVVLDDYQLLGFADTTVYARALPTFYKNTLYWEEADTIVVETSMNELNIVSQLEPTEAPSGQGLIDGYVVEDSEASGGGRIQAPKRVQGAGVSVRRVENSGRGKEEILTLVSYVFTNENGEFEFVNLPTGDYRLNIQYPGYPMDTTSFLTIPIGTSLESQKRVEATVDEGKITVRELIVTGVWESEEYRVDVYPNPSSSFIHVEFESSASRSLQLIDITGKTVDSKNSMENKTELDVRRLQNGVYLLSIVEKGSIVKIVRVEVK